MISDKEACVIRLPENGIVIMDEWKESRFGTLVRTAVNRENSKEVDMFKGISFIVLFVSDLERSLAFYRDKLGFLLKSKEPGYVEFDTEGVPLALMDIPSGVSLIGSEIIKEMPGRQRQFSLSLGEVEDVDATYEKLKNKGVEFVKAPSTQEWGQRTAHLRDPDGNVWEIYAWVQK